MIQIERLSIRLPNQLRLHAEYISRRVAEDLANAHIGRKGRIDNIVVSPVKSRPGDTPDNIAQEVSKRIINGINGIME